MSANVVLVAGHCTEPPADSAQVWFDTGEIPAGSYPLTPVEDRPPCTGYTGWPCEGGDATGTPHTHPQYDPDAFFLHDLGVVVLGTDVTGAASEHLPTEGQLSTARDRTMIPSSPSVTGCSAASRRLPRGRTRFVCVSVDGRPLNGYRGSMDAFRQPNQLGSCRLRDACLRTTSSQRRHLLRRLRVVLNFIGDVERRRGRLRCPFRTDHSDRAKARPVHTGCGTTSATMSLAVCSPLSA